MNPNLSSANPSHPAWFYYLVAALVGLLTGVVGAFFHQLVEHSYVWFGHLPQVLGIRGFPLYAVMAVLAAALMCSAVALVRHFAPEAGGSGVQEIEGAMLGQRQIRWKRVLPVKFLGGFLALTSGLIGGREGPTIHMGGAIAQAVGSHCRFTGEQRRSLWGAGGAAGLAAAFNAPVASIIFILEEARKHFPYSAGRYTAVVLACGCSAVATGLISGVRPFMPLSAQAMPLAFLPAFIALGIVFGVVGVLFNRGVIASANLAQALSLRISPYALPLALGCVIGPLLVALPEATGGGERFVVQLVHNPLPVGLLGVLVLLRFFGTLASYSVGAPSGIFAPILALATAISVLLASLLTYFIEVPSGTLIAFVVAGMAGLFTSTVRAPLVGIVLVAELTGTYVLALPVLLTAIVANITAEALGGRPIYELLLERTLRLNPGGMSVQTASTPSSL